MRTEKYYSDEKKMTHQDFIRLCETIEYELLVENLASDSKRTTYMSTKVKKKILDLEQTKDTDSPYFSQFKELCRQMHLSMCIKNQPESELVAYINSMISNGHLKTLEIEALSSFDELTEREAYKVITKLFKSTIVFDVLDDRKTYQTEKYLDLQNNRLKPIQPEPSKELSK